MLTAGPDTNGDGYPDLLVDTASERLLLIYGGEALAAPWPAMQIDEVGTGIVLGDTDGDALGELAYALPGIGRLEVLDGRALAFDADADGTVNEEDCALDDRSAYPGAPELCDDVDHDCDGDLLETFLDADQDGLANCIDPDFGAEHLGRVTASGGLGQYLALGDVDGDGTHDLVAAAPEHSRGFEGEGAAWIWTSPVWRASHGIWGALPGAGIGPVALGDVDGDGHDDLLAGAPGIGVARLLRGSADGVEPGDWWRRADLGASAVALLDLDGDGLDDLLVGDANTDTLRWWAGGPEGPSASPRVLVGPTGFGRAIATGDLDGDGWTDLIVGAEDALVTVGGSERGPDPATIRTYAGPLGSRLGHALVSSDVDGDGLGDVAVGAPGARAAHLLRGTIDGLVPWRSWHQPDHGRDGEFGAAVALADLNGDGHGD
ncbi:MAG: hypothetical protein GY913_20845, partial [Proteobacteria bacterium]|nr:hypothetical protein [Pseudomonadota bacterium]